MMFGLTVDEIKLQPKEIGDDVYVPIHTKQGGTETTMYMRYEDLMEQMDGDSDLGTDDFRYDP